jgi:hypothetical protein
MVTGGGPMTQLPTSWLGPDASSILHSSLIAVLMSCDQDLRILKPTPWDDAGLYDIEVAGEGVPERGPRHHQPEHRGLQDRPVHDRADFKFA